MTDNDIIKALECCNNGWCDKRCPYYDRIDVANCMEQRGADQLDLINRQKAEIETMKERVKGQKKALFEQQAYSAKVQSEIEWLREINSLVTEVGQEWQKLYEDAKAEAIKEFAERLKEQTTYHEDECGDFVPWVDCRDIDNLVKEMVGDNNA